MKTWTKFLVGITLLTFAATNLPAQSIFAALTGVVSGPSGGLIPNASVKLKSEATGSLRDTVTNSDGYFTFASVPVGDFTYELSVEAQGFASYKAAGIALGGGDKRNLN